MFRKELVYKECFVVKFAAKLNLEATLHSKNNQSNTLDEFLKKIVRKVYLKINSIERKTVCNQNRMKLLKLRTFFLQKLFPQTFWLTSETKESRYTATLFSTKQTIS